MAEKGIEAASLNAICDRAGFTRGAFYVHFRDRDELVAAVVERVLGDFQDDACFPTATARPTSAHDRHVRRLRCLSGVPEAVGTSRWKFHHTLAACAGSVGAFGRSTTACSSSALERLAAGAAAGQKNQAPYGATSRRERSPRSSSSSRSA